MRSSSYMGIRMFRRAVWGSLGLLLLWMFVITLLYGLLLHANRNRIQEFKDEVVEIEECCEDFDALKDDIAECIPACRQTLNNTRELVFGRGCWNANTNTPTLATGVCDPNEEYVICTPGSTTLEEHNTWEIGNVIKCLNDSGTVRWIKVTAESPSAMSGPFLHTFSYPNSGDSNVFTRFQHVIGHYWVHGTRVYIQGRAKRGRPKVDDDVKFRVGNLPIRPRSIPVGYMEASTPGSNGFIVRGRDYATTVVPVNFDTVFNRFDFKLNGLAFKFYDLLFELSYDSV